MLSKEQVEFRRSGIGSSDIAALVGKSPFAGPLDVYLSKREGVDLESTFSMELGDLMEPVVLTLYERRLAPTRFERSPGTFRHSKLPFVIDSPDARAWFGDERRVGEAKAYMFADTDEWGEEGTDEIAEHVLLQCQWHMLRERDEDPTVVRCDVPILVGAREFRVYRVDWDEELAGILTEEAARFWRDHVEKSVPPDPEGSRRVGEWLAKKHPMEKGPMLQADLNDEAMLGEFFEACAAHDASEARVDALKAKLQMRIGDAEGLIGSAGQLTWRKTKDSVGVNWEALAMEFLAKHDAAARATLLKKYEHVTKKGGRRFNKKPARSRAA